MKLNNESDRVKREVLVRAARALFAGTPETLDRIPLEMRPKGKPFSRCCVYKDRAALRYRVMAALGFRVEDESDELKPLAAYAEEVPSRTRNPEPFISILAEGCSACLESQTTVTNLCRSCLARPCVGNCPKQAVHIKNGRAEIDRDGQVPQLLIEVNRERAARHGLNVGDVQDVIEAALAGKAATSLWEGERKFAVAVRLPKDERSIANLPRTPIATPDGG